MSSQSMPRPTLRIEHRESAGPIHLVLARGSLDVRFHGTVAKYLSKLGEIWILGGLPGTVTSRELARLLALLLIDHEKLLLWPGFFPPCPGGAILYADGQIRYGRNRILPAWALKEMERAAGVLLDTEMTYLDQMVDWVNGSSGQAFRPVPGALMPDTPVSEACLLPAVPAVAIDLSACPMKRDHLSWFSEVRVHYRGNRYMSHLSPEAITRRVGDIVRNLMDLSTAGQLTVDPHSPLTRHLFQLFAEAQEEFQLRGLPSSETWPTGPDLLPRDGIFRPGALSSARSLMSQRGMNGDAVVRYGQARHMRALLADGDILLRPASYYRDDCSLPGSVKDDELESSIDTDLGASGLVGFRLPSEIPAGAPKVRINWALDSDYYVYCVSERLSPRLLIDFEATAAVVIHEPAGFFQRLEAAISAAASPGNFEVIRVQYFDPLQVAIHQAEPRKSKHFRFAIQRELRAVWIPDSATSVLPELRLRIGDLSDVGELILPTSS